MTAKSKNRIQSSVLFQGMMNGLGEFRTQGANSWLGKRLSAFIALASFGFTLWGLILLFLAEEDTMNNLLSAISLFTLVSMVATFLTFWKKTPKLRNGTPDPTFFLIALAFLVWIIAITLDAAQFKNDYLSIFLDVFNSTLFLLTFFFFEFRKDKERIIAANNKFSKFILKTPERVIVLGVLVFLLGSYFNSLGDDLKIADLVTLVPFPLVVYNLLVVIVLFGAIKRLYDQRAFKWLQRTLLPAVIGCALIVIVSELAVMVEEGSIFEKFSNWRNVLMNFYRIGIGILFLSLGFSFLKRMADRRKNIIQNTELSRYHDHKNILPLLYASLDQMVILQKFDPTQLNQLSKRLKSYSEMQKLLYAVKKGKAGQHEKRGSLVLMIKKYVEKCRDLFFFKGEEGVISRIRFKNNLPPKVEEQLDLSDNQLADLQRILFELTVNADKHAYSSLKENIPGYIYLTLMPEVVVGEKRFPRWVNLVVSDDGKAKNAEGIAKGLSTQNVAEIKAIIKASDEELIKSGRTGWRLINAILKHHQWAIDFQGKPGEGATFIVSIPLKSTQW
jgi:anti-sigma regulatory factor (Ser/Thr protein kinase)